MDKKDYLTEAYRQLNDTSIYKRVEEDLNPSLIKQFTNFFNLTKNKLDKNLERYLIPKQWRTPIFYTLPKIHKPDNPGRPIVSAINAPTSRMSEVVDDILKPLIKNIDSYIRDTNDFLIKIKNISPVPKKQHIGHRRCFSTIHIYPAQRRFTRYKRKTGHHRRQNHTHLDHT